MKESATYCFSPIAGIVSSTLSRRGFHYALYNQRKEMAHE